MTSTDETSLERLRDKLCRELAQSEHDAAVHCDREAQRYGNDPPGPVLRTLADHARELRPKLHAVWGKQTIGVRAGRAVGEVFSALRHFVFDWMIDAERSYRATLLGLRHGIGVAQLLREILSRQRDRQALEVIDELIARRSELVEQADERLSWFAEHPDVALRSARPKRFGRTASMPSSAPTR